MFFLIVQGIGILGIIASVISFQCKKHNYILGFRTVNEFLFALQYLLLGAYTGVAMNLIGCVRNIVFAEMVRKKMKTIYMCVLCSAVFLIFTAITWDGAKSILIGLAKVISTFAYGNKNTKIVRWLILFTSSSWLVYNIVVGSYTGALCELLTICSIIAGIIRIDILQAKSNENGDYMNITKEPL